MRPGQIIPITQHVSLLAGQNAGCFPFSHGVLLTRGATALVDTGAGSGVLGPLSAQGEVELVLNTHTHPDHTAGNHFFAGAEILVPEQGLPQAGLLHPLSHRFVEPGPLARAWRPLIARVMGFKDQPPTGTFRSGQRLSAGGVTLEAVHLPGHTADHHAFFLPGPELVISADVDLTPFGPWYGHRESGLEETRRSIRRVMELKPRILVSSHREPLVGRELIQEELRRFLGIIDQREARLLGFLKTRRTRGEIVEQAFIYKDLSWAPEILSYWEGKMIDLHLAELTERGLVTAGEAGFRAA